MMRGEAYGLTEEDAEAGAGTRFTMPSDVTAAKVRIQALMASVSADVAACAQLSDADRTAWALFYAGWRAFYCLDAAGTCTEPASTIFGSGGALDACDLWENQLADWQKKLSATCKLSAPIDVPPVPIAKQPDAMGDWLKWGVIGLGIFLAIKVVGETGLPQLFPRKDGMIRVRESRRAKR